MTQLIARLLKLPCSAAAIARNDEATLRAEAVLRAAGR